MDALTLREIRERNEITKKEMATLMGITDVSNYIRLENLRRPLTKIQIAAILNIDFVARMDKIDDLLDHIASHTAPIASHGASKKASSLVTS